MNDSRIILNDDKPQCKDNIFGDLCVEVPKFSFFFVCLINVNGNFWWKFLGQFKYLAEGNLCWLNISTFENREEIAIMSENLLIKMNMAGCR